MFNIKIWTISSKIHTPYEWMAIGGWTPTYTKEVTGNWYIDLTDAVANHLMELKAYWWCVQATTPAPTTPVDIVCNNWTLKVKKESWLPLRYRKVEYITADWTQWLNTWIKLASTDVVEAEYENSSSSWYWALYWVYAMWDSSAFYANWTYYWYDVANSKVDTWISVDTSRHTVRHDFVNWVITLDGANTTYTPFIFENTKDNYLFSRYYNNSYWYWFKGSCRKYRIYRWWELICDLVPVIDTQNNNEPWMYDLVSEEFRWNLGTWDLTAWAEVQDNVEVYVDGTKEKVWYSGWATTTCEDLLWVWDYKDEQEILSWDITRKVGIKVLDWTENIWKSTQYAWSFFIRNFVTENWTSNLSSFMITHFQTETVEWNYNAQWKSILLNNALNIRRWQNSTPTIQDFSNRLKDQMAAWTPVIVVYPLATPTTLSVAWQHLSIPAWDSRIEITEWSILNLPLYAKYKSTTE
jgi:hypothetical protein